MAAGGCDSALDVRQLVERCRRGDELAMAAIVSQYRCQVFGLCYRMLNHRHDAEDITQEAFVRAFRSLPSWDDRREFAPWLLAIAANRCRTLLASRARVPHSLLDAEHVEDADNGGAERARNLLEELQLALGNLRDEHRQAFSLFHEQELSYAEIAQVLVCPVGTVKTWVHRARRELVERLTRRGVFEEEQVGLRRI